MPPSQIYTGPSGQTVGGGMPFNFREITPKQWVLIAGVGVGVVWFAKRNGGGGIFSGSSGDDSGESEYPTSYIDTSNNPGVGAGSGVFSQFEPPVANTPSTAVIEDNNDWAVAAINFLIKANYDPARADRAIRQYIAGEKLEPAEGVMVSIALAGVGAPPELLPAGPPIPTLPVANQPTNPSNNNPPAVKPVPKPAKDNDKKNVKYRYHVVKPGNTLGGLAKKYYGNNDYMKIYKANVKGKKRVDGSAGILTSPNVIRVGQKLVIP